MQRNREQTQQKQENDNKLASEFRKEEGKVHSEMCATHFTVWVEMNKTSCLWKRQHVRNVNISDGKDCDFTCRSKRGRRHFRGRAGERSPFSPTFETPTGKHTSCYPRLVWRKWKVGHFLPFPLLMSWVESLSSVPWPQLSAVKSTESGDTGRSLCTSYSRLCASVIKPATTKP